MTETFAAPDEAVWACVAEGFFVGSRRGSFLGYVDRQPDGSWRAFDAASQIVGDFPDHHAALAATTAAATIDGEPLAHGAAEGDGR
jgi:hypothetical protein